MPLSENEQTNKTASELVDIIRSLFGTPQDARPAHAKGRLTRGTFTPTKEAAALSKAQIFHQPSTPLIVRFSSATGIPGIPDSNPGANPRGLAVRFLLSEDEHTHYDIIHHAKNSFAVRTGEEFLEMLQAVKNGNPEKFLADHPHAKEFNETSPGFPKSFGTEQFFGVHAFKFINDKGESAFFRYRIVPADGPVEHISQEEAEKNGKDYLYEELSSRLAKTDGVVRYNLLAQLAGEGDATNDATQVWPETRKFVTLGTIEVDRTWDENPAEKDGGREQKRIIYDPVPRNIQGIDVSDDPLIDMRAAVYLISGKIRREASGVA